VEICFFASFRFSMNSAARFSLTSNSIFIGLRSSGYNSWKSQFCRSVRLMTDKTGSAGSAKPSDLKASDDSSTPVEDRLLFKCDADAFIVRSMLGVSFVNLMVRA
jgi:hypothetical protein